MTTLSTVPATVKARRWRERKRKERAGYTFVTVAVSPYQVRALRRLGLVPGDPDSWQQLQPEPADLIQALRQLLEAAEPLAQVAHALCPDDTESEGGDRKAERRRLATAVA